MSTDQNSDHQPVTGEPEALASGSLAVASADEPELSGAQLAEAQRYGRLKLICELADKALDVALLAVVALLLARPLDAWLAGFFGNAFLRLGLLFLIVTGLHTLASLPLLYYSGHILERSFGLSQLSTRGWAVRLAKRMGVAAAFGLAMLLGLYGLIWLVGDYWWLAAAGAFFVVSVLAGQLAPVLILPLFYKIERLDDPILNDRLSRLAAGTGLSIQGVYRIALSQETVKANAMLAGLGRTRRVLLGDTLLKRFTPDELEVIFAHEIGHHVYRHIHKLIAAGVVSSAAGFWVCDRVLAAWVEQIEGHYTPQALPVYTLPMLMLVLTVFALLLEPLQNIVSRHYERQCDRYALARTGLKAAYVSAFRKLARLNKSDPCPNPIAVFLFHSHPPISARLRLAEEE